MNNLEKLRKLLKDLSLQSFLLPINDEFLSEYTLESNRRLFWLTEFTGSFAVCLVTQNECHFFTDSRYVIQAKHELTDQYILHEISKKKPWQIAEELNLIVHYDPKLVTEKFLCNFSTQTLPLGYNPIDKLWEREKNSKITNIKHHPIEYSGEESVSKCKRIAAKHPIFFTDPESICWLLNIRGNDVEYTPIILARAILYPDTTVKLFVANQNYQINECEKHYKILPIDDLENHLKNAEMIILDRRKTTKYHIDLINCEKIINLPDPCELPKACKNDIEITGAINAHKRDGIAVRKFINWLENNVGCTELKAVEMLQKFREEQPLFKGMSFSTISAFGANGAIVHYHPSEKSNAVITEDNLYLFDSGAQYLDGTTDITRTICLGNPTEEQKFHYTLVLKAHIALATAVFPIGVTGKQLDSLARIHLWKCGLDYGHGTGHGVGGYLNVHEGPQSFGSDAILKEGMIISNEPGFYKEGCYGIRLENLMYVARKDENFLHFKTLTQVPFDNKLVNNSLLNEEEILWLNNNGVCHFMIYK